MAQWRQFVGSYNAKKLALAEQTKRQAEQRAKREAERKAVEERHRVIDDLVASVFWRSHCRSKSDVAKAYATADLLANLGGEDFEGAIDSLNRSATWFKTDLSRVSSRERGLAYEYSRSAYADACAVMLIPV